MRSTSGGRPDEGASRAGGALNRRPAGPMRASGRRAAQALDQRLAGR